MCASHAAFILPIISTASISGLQLTPRPPSCLPQLLPSKVASEVPTTKLKPPSAFGA